MRAYTSRELIFVAVVMALGIAWLIGLANFEKRLEKPKPATMNDGYRERNK